VALKLLYKLPWLLVQLGRHCSSASPVWLELRWSLLR
jgi:hypothetical protein